MDLSDYVVFAACVCPFMSTHACMCNVMVYVLGEGGTLLLS